MKTIEEIRAKALEGTLDHENAHYSCQEILDMLEIHCPNCGVILQEHIYDFWVECPCGYTKEKGKP